MIAPGADSAAKALMGELETLRKGDGIFVGDISPTTTPVLLGLGITQNQASAKTLTLQEAAFDVLRCVAGHPSLGRKYQPIVWRTFNFAGEPHNLAGRRAGLMRDYQWSERAFRTYDRDALMQYAAHLRILTYSPCDQDREAELARAWNEAVLVNAELEKRNGAALDLARHLMAVLDDTGLNSVYQVGSRKGASLKTRKAFRQILHALPIGCRYVDLDPDQMALMVRQQLWRLVRTVERHWFPSLYTDEPKQEIRSLPDVVTAPEDYIPKEESGQSRIDQARYDAWEGATKEHLRGRLETIAALALVVERSGEWARVFIPPEESTISVDGLITV